MGRLRTSLTTFLRLEKGKQSLYRIYSSEDHMGSLWGPGQGQEVLGSGHVAASPSPRVEPQRTIS